MYHVVSAVHCTWCCVMVYMVLCHGVSVMQVEYRKMSQPTPHPITRCAIEASQKIQGPRTGRVAHAVAALLGLLEPIVVVHQRLCAHCSARENVETFELPNREYTFALVNALGSSSMKQPSSRTIRQTPWFDKSQSLDSLRSLHVHSVAFVAASQSRSAACCLTSCCSRSAVSNRKECNLTCSSPSTL
jgi:hypothetical protein